MANINTNKNPVEIRSELNKSGVRIEYIVINGQKIGILGSTNEVDRNAAIKALNDAYVASGGDIAAMVSNLTTVAKLEEKQIVSDEVVTVCGEEIIISYESAKAYTMSGEEIATCEDLPNMPREAIKAVLVARAENAL
jgi:hypothetical protein